MNSASNKETSVVSKDDVVTLEIEDISMDGEGVGKYKGYTLFVKDTIVGDRARVKVIKTKKNYGYGRLVEIEKASPDRIAPKCPIARQCGGCQIQEMSYESQLRFKQKLVENNLERIGGILPGTYEMYDIIGMDEPWHYRNKAQFPVGTGKNGEIKIGFYAGRTHSIIETEKCYLGASVNEQVVFAVRRWMESSHILPYDEEKHKGLVRHILVRQGFKTGEVMVCLVINADKLKKTDTLIDELAAIKGMTSITTSTNTDRTNVIMGNKINLLWGREYIEDYIGKIKYRISPLSFFQVNPVQTEKLYNKALEYAELTGRENVWDLYCGIGTISLFLAGKCKKVHGVEIIPQAVDDAKENARINGIENAEFFVGKAEEVLPAWFREEEKKTGAAPTADVIVVDPPRKGCDKVLLDTMVSMKPERIVYVSCDSSTLARDIAYLTGKDYQVKKVQPVDQFGHTVHVETVVLMSRVKGK